MTSEVAAALRAQPERAKRRQSKRAAPPEPPTDPVAAARFAGLRYVSDTTPGIRRRRAGRGFHYTGPDGATIRDRETLKRIRALAIPPAWTDVWICPLPNGHIQASGRDARGRKQYRYHARWREVRDETKYSRTIAFARALPKLRERVEQDLARRGLPREKVLATIVKLLETTFIRVGNEEYARANRSYGLTTMRDRHARIDGTQVKFRFRGKSGKEYQVGVRDRRVAAVVKRSQELPGQHLFQYVDEDGVRRTIDSDDVNEYIREATGEDFTAKDFRTWAGTLLAATALKAAESVDSQAAAKRVVVKAIEGVARKLGNTPAVCRRCYVHPAIIESYMDGTMIHALKERAEGELATSAGEFDEDETAVLELLQKRLAEAERTGHAA